MAGIVPIFLELMEDTLHFIMHSNLHVICYLKFVEMNIKICGNEDVYV